MKQTKIKIKLKELKARNIWTYKRSENKIMVKKYWEYANKIHSKENIHKCFYLAFAVTLL